MIASRVHAIIAAGLENPELLARWKRQPDLLRACGVDPAAFDLDAISKFAGLTAKIRHNGLRSALPLTFRLLNITGLEIEVFGAYATFKAREGTRYASTSEERTIDLLNFLEQWLDFDKQEHALLWDLIRHETALAQLRKLANSFPQSPVRKAIGKKVPTAASVPRICGHIILHEMRSDPRAVGSLLRQRSNRLDEVPLATFYVCYWSGSGPDEICILALDELGYYLLSLIDQERSVSDLSRLLGGNYRPSKNLLTAFAQLATVGIIAFNKGLKSAE